MIWLIIFVCVLLYIYSNGTKNFDYWKKKGIKYEKPIPFFGSTLTQYIRNINESQRYADMYRKYSNEKYVGFFEGNKPALLIKDPEIIKYVMTNHFKDFHRRGIVPREFTAEPLLRNIVFADGDTWKLLRQKLTPFFSRAKLKAMFPLIAHHSQKLVEVMRSVADLNKEVDAHDLMARYTTDFIGSCCFGIDTDSLNHYSSIFRRIGKRIFKPTVRDIFVAIIKRVAPLLFKRIHYFEPDFENQILSLITNVMSARNYKHSGKNDFIDLILELKQSTKMVGESIENFESDGSAKKIEIHLDDELLAAQVFGFFGAGLETSSFASAILLHILAYHPEEQAQCRQEIKEVLENHEGILSFESLREIKFLRMAFRESCRLMPSPGFIIRKSVNTYTFPNTTLTIDEDVRIIISTEALHLDKQYFDNPQEFRPSRFHMNNIWNINKNIYLPFGTGPRSCIGEQLAIMQSLAGVATILRHYVVTPSKNTARKPDIDPTSTIVQCLKHGLPLKFLKIKEESTIN